MNLSCFNCGGIFTEWDSVECDSCKRVTHRETCGDYSIVQTHHLDPETHLSSSSGIAFFFCILCMEEFPEITLDTTELGNDY